MSGICEVVEGRAGGFGSVGVVCLSVCRYLSRLVVFVSLVDGPAHPIGFASLLSVSLEDAAALRNQSRLSADPFLGLYKSHVQLFLKRSRLRCSRIDTLRKSAIPLPRSCDDLSAYEYLTPTLSQN